MTSVRLLLVLIVSACAALCRADVLFTQPHDATGTLITSAYVDPDGSDSDEFVWDGFMLASAGNITEIRWRGGGAAVNEFEIAICASIPAGIQPDITLPPLLHRMTGNNAGQTPAGVFGGVQMYDYHYTLPQPFLAAANTRYWIQIIAWTPSWPGWGLARGGSGNHFARVPAVTGDYRYVYGSGDVAVTLVGTPNSCSSPTITLQPVPISACMNLATAVFTTQATGTGPFTYLWRRNGTPLYDGGPNGGGSIFSGTSTATLTIQSPSYWADIGTYDCLVSNACGPTATNGAALVLGTGPVFSSQPPPTTVCQNSTASFTVTVSNSAQTYRWTRNTVTLTNGPTPWGSTIAGASGPTLTITGAEAGDQANYSCVVTNTCGISTTPAVPLTVSPLPTVTLAPQSVASCELGPTSFTMSASAGATRRWQMQLSDGRKLDLQNPAFTDPVTGLSCAIAGATTPTLSISNVNLGAHPATFTVVVLATNSCGTNSAQADVTICAGDYDCSGGVDGDDVIAFFGDWDASGARADVNHDGGVDGDDVIAFFEHWDSGC